MQIILLFIGSDYMVDIEKEIEQAKKFLFEEGDYDHSCHPVWFGTTENISGYFNLLNWEGTQRVLCVCSSGDHIFNLIYHGIKQIDIFDSNPFTFPYFNLRLGLMASFSYDEYFHYFERLGIACSNKRKEYQIFEQIENFIPFPYNIYWKELYGEQLKCQSSLSLLAKFCWNFIPYQTNILRNSYLHNERAYEETKKLLKDCTFHFKCVDLKELPKCYRSNYDRILLSNISDYLPSPFNKNNSKYASFIEHELSSILSDNGEIVASYIYHYIYNGQFYGIHFKNSIDNNYSVFNNYPLFTFNHIDDFGNKEFKSEDAVLIYKK